LFLSGCAACATAADTAPAPLILQYDVRPPFLMRNADGSIGGKLAVATVTALEKAGIPYVWRNASPTRQLAILRANLEPNCAIGWYKTPERQTFVKYSKAIYQDAPMVGVANIHLQVPPNPRVQDVLGRTDVSVLLKESVVYGPYLDAQFAAMKARPVKSYEPYGQLIKLVQIGRVQLTFVPLEEAEYYVAGMGYRQEDFHFIRFADMPEGEKRYIICSMKTDDAVLQRIDAALK
jgi:hypothetical protein